MNKIVVVSFDVCGITHFPLDMLRHDACFPFDGRAVSSIECMLSPALDDRKQCFGLEHFARIRLSHMMCAEGSASRLWTPTRNRWLSFGWSVDPQNIQWNAWT